MKTPDELSTPSLLMDVTRVRRNAERMSARAVDNGVSLRPHVKTHKCVEVARIATEGHSGAVTASTIAEIEAFAAHGFKDFTYAVPIVPAKLPRIIRLLTSGTKVNLLTDDPDMPAELDKAARAAGVDFDVFLKVDCGYHRCGVEPGSKEAVQTVRGISDAAGLNFAGILTHAGHSYHGNSKEEIAEIAGAERDVMCEFAEELRSSGIPVPVISIGSTPTMTHVDHLEGIDEIRPGNYVFFDAFQATLGSCGFEDCAITVLASVVHRSFTNKKAIVDAGSIALSKDRGPVDIDGGCGYGRVLDLAGEDTGLRVGSLSQEHGEITVEAPALLDKLKVGTKVRILANHSCLTAAQFDHYEVMEGDSIVDRWEIHRGW
ncbi:MAG: alanine racemase [Acidobacteriota bacterium]|nr:MAG: alanine racemase [Acidobacteriota bacterium]